MRWQVELAVVLVLVGGAALWLLWRWGRTWRHMVHPTPNQPLCESCPFSQGGQHLDCTTCSLSPLHGGEPGAVAHPEGASIPSPESTERDTTPKGGDS